MIGHQTVVLVAFFRPCFSFFVILISAPWLPVFVGIEKIHANNQGNDVSDCHGFLPRIGREVASSQSFRLLTFL